MSDRKMIERLEDRDPNVRREASVALGKSGDARAVEPLVKCLEDERGRTAACAALGQLGDARAVEPLIKCLEDEWIRPAACAALGQLGDARAVEPLIKCLKVYSPFSLDRTVQRAACKALGRLGDARAVEPLIRCLKDEDSDVRRAAREALGQLGEGTLAQALGSVIDGASRRQRACEALGQLGDARAVEALVQSLGDRNSGVRYAAFKALGQLGEGPLANALRALIEGKSDGAAQLKQLAVASNADVTIVLLPLLRSGLDQARHGACKALGELGDLRAVDRLIDCLGDRDTDVRRAAVAGLRAIHGRARSDAAGYLCTEHLTRFELRRLRKRLGLFSYQTIRYFGCRVCGGAERLWQGVNKVVCVLDSESSEEADPPFVAANGRVHALWDPTRRLFDFDVIEIHQATDNDVERFCIKVGNDEDPDYKDCSTQVKRVVGYCRLSDYIWAMLRSQFPNAELLRMDEDWLARRSACKTPEQLGDVRAVEPPIERLGDERDNVRRNVSTRQFSQ